MKWYLDTSVLVAAAISRHPHHPPALGILKELASARHEGFVSAHSLAEFYSVLTRAPFKPPLYPGEVWQIIEAMVIPALELVTLTSKEYKDVIHRCALGGWLGGRVHDAVHLGCAQKAECDRIYTFNVKDFRALAPAELAARITQP